MKKNKTLHGYYCVDGIIWELWIDEDGYITQKKMK
tara:strand:- start:95 stop:199 length:105 start_codon:yes stop_codon:yes gene_type:complete